jgi:hypothetical protein
MQAEGLVDPMIVVYLPETQLMHVPVSEAPIAVANVPASHGVQEVEAVFPEYVPALHL